MFAELKNETSEAEFYISSFSVSENGRKVLAIIILLGYLMILAGNIFIISLICLNPHLQRSMYFFLSNLSVVDILYVSTTLPKLLYISFTGDHCISYTACITQLYLFLFLSDTESFLLVTMAIDRYVAICFPLHYSLIMSKKACILLAFPTWFMGSLNALILTYFVCSLNFFGFVEIQNFFCDLKAVLIESSSDTTFLRKFIVVDGMFIGSVPVLLILTSYTCIIRTILKIKSSTGRWKTFSSCTSHITIVVLFYGPGMALYMQYSQAQDTILSVIFVTLVPLFNPLVYSLRNDDFQRAIRNVTHGKKNKLRLKKPMTTTTTIKDNNVTRGIARF